MLSLGREHKALNNLLGHTLISLVLPETLHPSNRAPCLIFLSLPSSPPSFPLPSFPPSSLPPSLSPFLPPPLPLSLPPPPVPTLSARLSAPPGPMAGRAGRVEIQYNGAEWGTICDHNWTLADADVVCHMLEFRSALSSPGTAQFPAGNGTIWLDHVACFGNEITLMDCAHSGFRVHDCQHSNDVGVVCSGESGMYL